MQTLQKFWIKIIILIALAATAVYFYLQSTAENISQHSPNTETPQAHTHSENNTDPSQTNLKKETSTALSSSASSDAEDISPELQERLSAMNARRPNQSFDATEVAAAVSRTTSWTPTDTVHRNLPLAEEEFSDGRQFVDFDSLKIETLMPGDQVNIQTDDSGKGYQVTIDNIEKHDYNSISWHGHIEGDDGQRYKVSFTRGEHLMVGGFDTPDGHFVIQAHGNKGWVASSQLLFKQDTSVSDAIHPADVDPNYQRSNQNQHHNHTH